MRRIIFTSLALAGLCLVNVSAIAEEKADEAEAQLERLKAMTAEVITDVETLRGWEFQRPVELAVRTREELTERLERLMDERVPPDVMRRRVAFLKLTGIVPQHVDVRQTWVDMLAVGVGGYYDPDDETFHIMLDTASRYGTLPLGALIAHELTHALDDQHIGLDDLMDPVMGDFDREFAIAAVVEGSATALMTRYMVKKADEKGFGLIGLALGSLVTMNQDAEAMEAMQRSPRYFQTFLAAYTLGQAFYFWTNIENGQYVDRSLGDAVRQAAADPPRSAQQILHPAKYWDPDRRLDPIDVHDEDVHELVAALDADWQVVHAETAGELLMAIVTEPEYDRWFAGGGGAAVWTNATARPWRGDRFYVIEAQGDEDADTQTDPERGLWFTLWADEAARDRFTRMYEQHRPANDRRMIPFGDVGAVYAFGLDAEQAQRLDARLRDAPPGLTRGDVPWSLEP